MSMSGSTRLQDFLWRVGGGGPEFAYKVLHAHTPRLLSAEWREHVAAVARTAARGPEAHWLQAKSLGYSPLRRP